MIPSGAEGTSPWTPSLHADTHPQHRPREILIASGQETGGQPYFSQERAVPLWASPAVLETKQPMEREMDSCSHEGVNLCLPTIITTPMT